MSIIQNLMNLHTRQKRSWNLFILCKSIQEHVVRKYIELIPFPPHLHVYIESPVSIVRSQIRLKQRLISVAVHLQFPFPDQPLALLEVLGVPKYPDQDVHSGDVAARPSPLHVLDNRADLVKAVGRNGLGQDEEDAVVCKSVVAEVRGDGGAGLEEFEGEGGAV